MTQTVLITGASSGIGFAIAKIFSENNYNIVLVANNKDKLSAAARALQKDAQIITVIAKDLSIPNASDEIYKELHEKNITVDILINSAGFATYGLFTGTDLQEELQELQVNIVTLTHLTKLFVKDMVTRKQGKILNVASTAAFLPGPLMAVYYASKAYVLSFSEALAEELKNTGVSVSALCPGPTHTDFAKRGNLERSRLFQGNIMEPDEVAKAAYNGLIQNKTLIIPGLRNKLITSSLKFVPRNIIPRLVRIAQAENK